MRPGMAPSLNLHHTNCATHAYPVLTQTQPDPLRVGGCPQLRVVVAIINGPEPDRHAQPTIPQHVVKNARSFGVIGGDTAIVS